MKSVGEKESPLGERKLGRGVLPAAVLALMVSLCTSVYGQSAAGPECSGLGCINPSSALGGVNQRVWGHLNPAWLQKVDEAMQSKLREDWPGMVKHLTAALEGYDTLAKFNPKLAAAFSIQRQKALTLLGDALNRQGRPEEAIPYLKLAVQIDQDAAEARSGRKGETSFRDAMASASSIFAMAKSLSVNLNRSTIIEADDEQYGAQREAALTDELPPVTLPEISLMESYARLGQRQEMVALFEGPFKQYINRHRESLKAGERGAHDQALEAACVRMAIALARVGRSPQADEAFGCAMEFGSMNAQATVTFNAMFEAQAARRRFLLGAYAAYVFGTVAVDAEDARLRNFLLLANVAESKGASSRYRGRLRSIWMNSNDKVFVKARPALIQHERDLLEMPSHGEAAMKANARWTNEEVRLMGDIMPALLRHGLKEALKPGEAIVERAQYRLGASGRGGASEGPQEEVLIGYSFYNPVDFTTQKLSPIRVMRYVVSGDRVDVRDIGLAREVELLVGSWRAEVMAKKSGRKSVSAKRLSDRLLGDLPTQAVLAQDWVIDPDGVVSLLPFEALETPKVAGGVKVIERHRVRYVASIADFAFPSSKPASDQGGVQTAMVVADPMFSSEGSPVIESGLRGFVAASGVPMEKLRLQPLPDTRQEAATVSAALERMGVRTSVRLGEQATVAAFDFKTAPTYLHVATHGLYLSPSVQGGEERGPYGVRIAKVLPGMQSALALTPGESGGFLTGAQIAGLALSGTDLVVLSACDTGNGAVEIGEGVVSLRRAIEEAGARSSITSLWPVPSGATARFMSDFYTRLANGDSKLEALHQAKLALLKSSDDPRQWAGFLLAGEP